MSQLRQHERELSALQVQICVVTFEAGPSALAYVRETGLPWPLLVDENRDLYRAYGMERGNCWNVFGPASFWSYAKLLARGRIPKRPGGDPRQLGGDVLIDPQGVVRVHHVGSGPADRPTVAALLEPIRK